MRTVGNLFASIARTPPAASFAATTRPKASASAQSSPSGRPAAIGQRAVESLVILLPRDAVVATMQDAVEDPRFDRDFGFGCFMSGPSKTADIEQALVIGAHGPMSVTVVLTGGKEAAR